MIVLKIALAPTLIAIATLLGRRFGQSFAGWLVGFPFTSAPVSLFLAIEQGTSFASAAAVGSASGVIATATFALVYIRVCAVGWGAATVAATAAFAVIAVAMRALDPSATVATGVAALTLAAAQLLVPRRRSPRAVAAVIPGWDLPARAIVATVLVATLTTVAPRLGAEVTGIVSGFPLYATVLAVFAQRIGGPDDAFDVMRGLLAGLFGYASFVVVVAYALVPLGIVAAFGLALVTVLGVQGVSLVLLRRATVAPS